MKFIVLSRKDAKEFDYDKPYIVISITDPNLFRQFFPKSKNRLDVLRLQFHDWTKDALEKHGKELVEQGYVFFNKRMAKEIIEFINKYRDKIELIMIHCEAGISRSAAVGAALAKCLGQSNMHFFLDHRMYPNDLVYWTILDEWFGISYE